MAAMVFVLSIKNKGNFCDYCFKKRVYLHDCLGCSFMHYCDRNCENNDQIHRKNASYPTECGFFSSKKELLNLNFQNELLRLFLRALIKVKFFEDEDSRKFCDFSWENLLTRNSILESEFKYFNLLIEELMRTRFLSENFNKTELISLYCKTINHKIEIENQNEIVGLGIYPNYPIWIKNSTLKFDGNKILDNSPGLTKPQIACKYKTENEREQFFKQNFDLGCDCKKCHKLKTYLNRFCALQIEINSDVDDLLKLPIQISNMFLQSIEVKQIFEKFKVDREKSQEGMKKLKIIFAKHKKKKDEKLFGWSQRESTANSIFIDENFKTKLIELKKHSSENERQIDLIIFFMSIIILHELAHLLFRWSGIEKSLRIFREAGEYLEKGIFNGVVHLLVRPASTGWDENCEILELVLMDNSDSLLSLITVLSYEDYIKKICNNKISDPNEFILPECINIKMPKDSICQKNSFIDSTSEQDMYDDWNIKMMTFLYNDSKVRKCRVIDPSEK